MADNGNSVAIDPNLFIWPSDQPCLLGGRDKKTGAIRFPYSGKSYEDPIELARQGTLWSWTMQRFPPKRPPYKGPGTAENPIPYPVGYVELPGQVRVEARLTGCDEKSLRIGMAMELVIEPLFKDEQGRDVMCFAFRPSR